MDKENIKSDYESSDEQNESEEESQSEEHMDEEMDTADEESDESEGSVEDVEDADAPYPTPPPDPDANMSLGSGVKKTKIPSLNTNAAKPKMALKKGVKDGVKDAGVQNTAKNQNIISRCLVAIEALNVRSGSSVAAIVKHIKSTGYEISDEKRMSRLVLKSLKVGVANGQVVQIKRSFKLTEQAKKASKAVEKMKAKQENQKVNKNQIVPKVSAKPQMKTGKSTVKVTVRKTNEPRKKKPNTKIAAVAGDAKTAAAVKAQEALEKVPKPAKNTKTPKTTKDAESKLAKSSNSKAKAPRKSIGTLTQPKTKAKPQSKAIKKLVAGKMPAPDQIDSDNPDTPSVASTPIDIQKKKRKVRAVK